MDDPTRTIFHDALAKSDNAASRALADVVTGQTNGHLACWGDLVDYVRAHFQSDDDSMALWRVLTAVGDRRPQFLFLDIHRTRPAVLRALLAEIYRVPPIIQCALVSMPEVEPLVATPPDGLSPAAREIVTAPPALRLQERVLYESHMSSLRSLRASVPYAEESVIHHLAEFVLPLRAPVDAAPAGVPSPAPIAPIVSNPALAAHLIAEAGQALRPGGSQ